MSEWKLVPVDITPEKTPEMFNAALKWGTKKSEWQELLAAAPQPPALGVEPVQRFWAEEAQNIRCVRESDFDEQIARLRAELDRSNAEVERLNADLDLYKEGKEKLLFWCREARGETTKLRSALADHQSAAARTAELEGLLRDEQTRSKLTSLPLKLMFMKERNFQSIQEVHDWMVGVGNRIDAALAEGKEHE